MLDEDIRPLQRTMANDANALYVQIYDRIKEWLRSGALREGDALPSERELAQMFDVSRVPVREALKILEFLGIVQRERGKGVFIKKVSANNIIGTIDFVLANASHSTLELFEVRIGIETQATFLAAERRTEKDLEAIEASLRKFEKDVSDGQVEVGPTLDFHSSVIKASHNGALIEINQFLAEWLRYLRAKFMYTSIASEQGRIDHREIFELIKAGDSVNAAARMLGHLMRARDMIARAETEVDADDFLK